MKVLPGEGIEVAAACFARFADKLNVNKHEDAAAVKKLYRDRHPFCKPMIERIADRKEVVIRFYDMDDQKQVVPVNGLPSVRNYTRMLFPKVASLDEKSVSDAVSNHISELGARIEKEIGLSILNTADGVVA